MFARTITHGPRGAFKCPLGPASRLRVAALSAVAGWPAVRGNFASVQTRAFLYLGAALRLGSLGAALRLGSLGAALRLGLGPRSG